VKAVKSEKSTFRSRHSLATKKLFSLAMPYILNMHRLLSKSMARVLFFMIVAALLLGGAMSAGAPLGEAAAVGAVVAGLLLLLITVINPNEL
jgi:hypothetical protein